MVIDQVFDQRFFNYGLNGPETQKLFLDNKKIFDQNLGSSLVIVQFIVKKFESNLISIFSKQFHQDTTVVESHVSLILFISTSK